MSKILSILGITFLFLFFNWLGLPTISMSNGSFIFLLIVYITTVVSILVYSDKENINMLGVGIGSILLILFMIISFFTTSSMINAYDYQEIIENVGDIKEVEYNNNIKPIDPSQIIIIDEETAKKLGDKKLSDGNNVIGSQVVIGDYTLQKIVENGKIKLYYIAPLLHTGFFKWNRNRSGTPGYIKVSATNSKDVTYINDYKIKYQPNAFFSGNLKRHVRGNGFRSVFFTDDSFEIDDDGNPYWVYTKYDKCIGLSGNDAVGTIIVNAVTGDIEEYSIESTPEWVDRIQPLKFVNNQIVDWGDYVHGWYNPSNVDETKPTRGTSYVLGDDGNFYYYTGITSKGVDETSIGFIMTNTRTKETIFYRLTGATETKASRSAEGAVQNLGYVATFPRPYNINGELTYVMALKDVEGLIKKVALVSVKNYELVGVGNTIKDAIRSYKSVLVTSVNNLSLSDDINYKVLKGVIDRIKQDGKTGQFYFSVSDKKITNFFTLNNELNDEIILSSEGDSIVCTYYPSNDIVINLVKFDNTSLNFKKADIQVDLESNNSTILEKKIDITKEDVMDREWDKMTMEQKNKILQTTN